jgi:hypothetical protein
MLMREGQETTQSRRLAAANINSNLTSNTDPVISNKD